MIRISVLLFLLVVFIPVVSSQEYTLKIRKKIKESDYYPHFDRVMDGDIAIDRLCSSVLTNNLGWKVVSYALSYGADTGSNILVMEGDKIPADLCRRWKAGGYENLALYFTRITAIDKEGKYYTLSNLRLILTND